MRNTLVYGCLSLAAVTAIAAAQQVIVSPQVRTKAMADNKITEIELKSHFVTTIRVPEPVNSVVVGDPALFQVEHSEHEPVLVFVKALTNEYAESNLLISTTTGRQISFLLVSHGGAAASEKDDFLLRYQPSGGFLVEPAALPFALVAQTASVSKTQPAVLSPAGNNPGKTVDSQSNPESLDTLLERQKQGPLPVLYGERPEGDEAKGGPP
jgi:hypothetical protein